MLGARESWRIKGKYYLVEDDYNNQSRFADAVCRTARFSFILQASMRIQPTCYSIGEAAGIAAAT